MNRSPGNRTCNEFTVLDRRRLLGRLGLVGLGLASGTNLTAEAQTKADTKPSAKVPVSPAPADLNDLNLEVQALRTLYLAKCSWECLNGIHMWYRDGSAPQPRKRQAAKVSVNYRKVLTDLRAAFITENDARIAVLSEQLEELTADEQPEFDDAIDITDYARKNNWRFVNYLCAPPKIVAYLNSYGKDFPSPWDLLYKTMRLDGKGTKLPADEWKETRAFVIKEVSW
jgi:hypothetical protein